MNELQGRVRYVGNGRALISGRTYNELARLLRNISSETIQISVGPNGGLKLEVGSFGASSGGGGGGGDLYTGPFALSYDKTSHTVHIGGGCIFAGIVAKIFHGGTLGYSSGNDYVIMTINAVAGVLNVGFSAASVYPPTQSNTSYVVVLGTCDGESCRQWQHGDIYIAGRAV